MAFIFPVLCVKGFKRHEGYGAGLRLSDGLPVGIQIMGPYLEDVTSIDIAGLLADLTGGFKPPPGFA